LQQSLQPFFHGILALRQETHKIEWRVPHVAILQFMVASAVEAKLGALFLNCQEGMIF
jgi:hypothetical protein